MKKRKNRQNIRKRKVDDDDDDDTDVRLLADIRKEQRERVKTLKAVHDGSVRKIAKYDDGDGPPEEDVMPDDLDDEETATRKEEARRKLERMLDGSFTMQVDNGEGKTAHEKLMDEYINEKLGIEDVDKEEKKTVRSKRRDEDAELFAMDDKLKEIVASALPNKDKDAVDFGGATIAWNTGIAEVALPIEYKLKNVEDTEIQKRELALRKSGGYNAHPMAQFNKAATAGSSSGNVTANYHHHRREYAIMMRSREQKRFGDNDGGKGKGKGGGAPNKYSRDRNFSSNSNPNANPIIAPRGPKQQGQSSDDHVLNRFRKSWKR